MKFAREFQNALSSGGYPPDWVQSAISYGQLKKIIKKVQGELLELGLDAQTLHELLLAPAEETPLAHGAAAAAVPPPPQRGLLLQYAFVEQGDRPRPRLFLVIDTRDGQLVDAGLSEETKEYLRRFVRERAALGAGGGSGSGSGSNGNSDGVEPTPAGGDEGVAATGFPSAPEPSQSTRTSTIDLERAEDCAAGAEGEQQAAAATRQVEVPLTFDSEFFRLLTTDISVLDRIQEHEEARLTQAVADIGRGVSRAVAGSSAAATVELARWRDIFDLYLQAKVFFSTAERDRGPRSAAAASAQLQWFGDAVGARGLAKQFKRKESTAALERFLWLNQQLLRNLRFHEINRTATFKILKKFDKRTALGVKHRFPALLAGEPFLTSKVAKAVCNKLASEVLTTVPQLDDYLCPVCFGLAYKPVRLSCGHIFCIRCMVTMQRSRETHCPLCRGDVVMAADSTNLDPALINFLKRYFPAEVKAKQKANEQAAAVERWGENYDKCSMM